MVVMIVRRHFAVAVPAESISLNEPKNTHRLSRWTLMDLVPSVQVVEMNRWPSVPTPSKSPRNSLVDFDGIGINVLCSFSRFWGILMDLVLMHYIQQSE